MSPLPKSAFLLLFSFQLCLLILWQPSQPVLQSCLFIITTSTSSREFTVRITNFISTDTRFSLVIMVKDVFTNDLLVFQAGK